MHQSELIGYHRDFIEYKEADDTGEAKLEIPEEDQYVIELKNVCFSYPGSDAKVLSNVNLTLSHGERIALVGLNGAGKSTLVGLIVGLYDPSEGEILLNGVNIKRYDRSNYYKLFSAVFQRIHLFAFSIGENISMQEKGVYERDKVLSAVADAGLGGKVESLPLGIDTPLMRTVESTGVDLSGGEAQKLAMARALYKDAPFIILDEPTSALDPVAEEMFYTRFNELSQGKTMMFITHRLSSTRFCDRILLLDEGIICEDGTHNDLVRAGGKYQELYEVQSQYYKDKEA